MSRRRIVILMAAVVAVLLARTNHVAPSHKPYTTPLFLAAQMRTTDV